MNLSSEQIIARYCHLHPTLNKEKLRTILAYQCQHFHWSGFNQCNYRRRWQKILIIENNSCPSGQKPMPFLTTIKRQAPTRWWYKERVSHLLTRTVRNPRRDNTKCQRWNFRGRYSPHGQQHRKRYKTTVHVFPQGIETTTWQSERQSKFMGNTWHKLIHQKKRKCVGLWHQSPHDYGQTWLQ